MLRHLSMWSTCCRSIEGCRTVREAFLSKQKESCKHRFYVTARHSNLGLPVIAASTAMKKTPSRRLESSGSPPQRVGKPARAADEQSLVSVASNRSAYHSIHKLNLQTCLSAYDLQYARLLVVRFWSVLCQGHSQSDTEASFQVKHWRVVEAVRETSCHKA